MATVAVPAAVTAKLSEPTITMFSTPLTVKPERLLLLAAVAVIVNVSVPVPPSMESPELTEVAAKPVVVEVAGAVNVSFKAEPTNVSIPVVSDLFCTQNDVNTHLFYLYFDIRPDIDSITTIDHQ